MIAAAAKAGADAVKFQTFHAEELVLDSVEHFGLVKNCELSSEDHLRLAQVARANGVTFISTPFDARAVSILEQAGVPAFKIASMDVTNLPLLRVVARTRKPVILSTGMASLAEVAEAVETISAAGNDQTILLHCVSKYPTEPHEANLPLIPYLRDTFALPVGWSDHTLGNAVSLAAVAIGAGVIEKHFTLDKNLPGPDHALSADPAELAALVNDVRRIEKALSPCGTLISRSDRDNARIFRRGIHAAGDIPAGTIITAEMLRCVRPEEGLSPRHLDLIIGRSARKAIARNQALTAEDV